MRTNWKVNTENLFKCIKHNVLMNRILLVPYTQLNTYLDYSFIFKSFIHNKLFILVT